MLRFCGFFCCLKIPGKARRDVAEAPPGNRYSYFQLKLLSEGCPRSPTAEAGRCVGTEGSGRAAAVAGLCLVAFPSWGRWKRPLRAAAAALPPRAPRLRDGAEQRPSPAAPQAHGVPPPLFWPAVNHLGVAGAPRRLERRRPVRYRARWRPVLLPLSPPAPSLPRSPSAAPGGGPRSATLTGAGGRGEAPGRWNGFLRRWGKGRESRVKGVSR